MAKNLHENNFDIWINPYDGIKLILKPLPPPANDINVEKLHAMYFEKMQ